MKRMFVCVAMVLLSMALSGCMATLGSLSGNGPVAQARRDTYVKAHPGNPFNSSIQAGSLAVGMSLDDMRAVYGSNCGYSSDSSAGTFYQCRLNMLDQYDTMLVLVDNSGRVASWIE